MRDDMQLTPQQFFDRFSEMVFDFGQDGQSLYVHFDVGRELVKQNLPTAKAIFGYLFREVKQSDDLTKDRPIALALGILGMLLHEVTNDKRYIVAIQKFADLIPISVMKEASPGTIVEEDERPDNPLKILEHAHFYHQQGQLAKAESLYKRLVNLVPNAPAVYNELGRVYADQRRPKEAEAAYKKAIELDFTLAGAHRNLGLLYYHQLGDKEKGVQCFKRAARIQSDFFEAYNDIGAASLEKGDLVAAKQNFEAALSINPDYMQATSNLSLVYLMEGRRKLEKSEPSGVADLVESTELMKRVIQLAPYSREAKMARQNLEVVTRLLDDA